MAVPSFTMRQLIEAGVHFGHHPRRWNPRMEKFIFGVRNGVHIIDLDKTFPLLKSALEAVHEVSAAGGRILFVGTKRQASEKVAAAAKRCGQYYVDHRWLGGMLTNWKTISNSIKRLRDLDEQLSDPTLGLVKKELLGLTRERNKLELALGGIKDMGGLPNLIFVIDTTREHLAVKEAAKLGLPIVAIVDTNATYDDITHIIPGNDDASRAIELYCDLVASTVLDGMQNQMRKAGIDVGESSELPDDAIVDAGEAEEVPAEAIADATNAAAPEAQA